MVPPVTRVDPHVKVLDESVVRLAKQRDLDTIVYAPHFVRLPDIEARAAAHSDAELTVLPGREIFTGDWRNRRHLLAIGLDHPVPDFISLEGALQACERQGASVLVPHPTFMTVSLTASEVQEHVQRIDAIERYNPKFLPTHTRAVGRLVRTLDVPTFGSSYAHLAGTVGEVWTEVRGRIDSVDALQVAIAENGFLRVRRREGMGHFGRRAIECGHLVWENSWKKFDRVVLHDREATHPQHPTYEGRFDAVAVY